MFCLHQKVVSTCVVLRRARSGRSRRCRFCRRRLCRLFFLLGGSGSSYSSTGFPTSGSLHSSTGFITIVIAAVAVTIFVHTSILSVAVSFQVRCGVLFRYFAMPNGGKLDANEAETAEHQQSLIILMQMGIDAISRCHKISTGIDEIQIPDMASAAMATLDALKGAAHIQCGVGLLELAEQCMRNQPSFHDPQYEEHHGDAAWSAMSASSGAPPPRERSCAPSPPRTSGAPPPRETSGSPPPQHPWSTAFRGPVPFPTTTLQPRPQDDDDMSPIHRKRRKLMRRTNGSLKAKKYRKRRSHQHQLYKPARSRDRPS